MINDDKLFENVLIREMIDKNGTNFRCTIMIDQFKNQQLGYLIK